MWFALHALACIVLRAHVGTRAHQRSWLLSYADYAFGVWLLFLLLVLTLWLGLVRAWMGYQVPATQRRQVLTVHSVAGSTAGG